MLPAYDLHVIPAKYVEHLKCIAIVLKKKKEEGGVGGYAILLNNVDLLQAMFICLNNVLKLVYLNHREEYMCIFAYTSHETLTPTYTNQFHRKPPTSNSMGKHITWNRAWKSDYVQHK